MSDPGDSRTDESDFEPPRADTAEQTSASDVGPDAAPSIATTSGIDLDAIQHDLEGVQTALERLNEGTYWTDEVTGGTIPDEVLDAFPLTRTVAGTAAS